MPRPSVRSARIAGWIAVPAALVLSGAAIAGASYSAFSATTSNPTSNWSTGTVSLTDDDSDTALFTASNLGPGATGTKCIVVTSTGTLASTVKLYGTGLASTKSLSDYVKLTVNIGTGGSFNNCSGFSSTAQLYSGTVSGFAAAATSYQNGLGSWTSSSTTDSRTYQFTYTIDTAIPNTAQGGTAALGFTWEAQN